MSAAAYVYILKCADGSLYTGWTTDPERRLAEHNSGGKGAKYTKGRGPCSMVYLEEFSDRKEAMKREWEIKNRMTREEKLALIQNSLQNRGSVV